MSLPKYPEYKDSGVSWLGEVPAHWDVCRLKSKLSLRTEKAERRIFPVALENIEGWTGRYLETETEFQGEGVSFDSGDILFGKLRPYLAKVLLAQCAGEAVGDFHVLRPSNDIVGRYAQYQMLARNFIDFVNGETFGSKMPRASWDSLGGMPFVSPSPSEQVKIATFLDRETAKIDALIAEQEKLIALLAEKRQATISRAVTRGLDPNVPLKDSGVPWLGKVPAHWEMKQLKTISMQWCDGPFGSGIKSEHYTDEGVFVVRLQNVRAVNFNYGDPVFLDRDYYERDLKRHSVIAGDLLVAGLGDDKNLLGRACVAPSDLGVALVKADCFRFRLNSNWAVPDFVAMQLSAGAAFDAGVLATGTTRSRIPLSIMASRRVVMPPISEQNQIVSYLIGEMERLDRLVDSANTSIDLLKERRAALISAAVTGKIDVRGLAA